MTKMQLWSPFHTLWDLQDEVNRALRGFTGSTRSQSNENSELTIWSPLVDIYEDKEAVKLTVELPGMKKEDVRIHMEEGVLTLKGERKFTEETKKENYYRIERNYGTFSRSFTLPATVDHDKISASMNHGLLEILISKKEEAKPKEITIR